MSNSLINLDYNATTPMDPRVVDAMLPMFTTLSANPSSKHAAGQAAAQAVENSRREIAALLGTQRRHVVFTSGATEAAALAIRGVIASASPRRTRILVSATEHKAVLAAAHASGSIVHTVAVHRDGTVNLDHLDVLLGDDVALVAVMAANNETGTLNDVSEVARLAHRSGALFCCDVTQAVGKIPVRLDEWGVDLAMASAHKLYGPKGIGVLAATRVAQDRLTPLFSGGGQERGLRGGTVNTAGAVGFGAAARLAADALFDAAPRQRELVRLLHSELAARTDLEVHGYDAPRLPNTISVRFPGADADAVLACLPDVLISPGSACQSARHEPSHVLLAMGIAPNAALETLRFSVGRPTTEQEIRAAAVRVADAVARVRALHRVSLSRRASA